MAMGKREGEQEDLFVTHQQLRSQSHPFYRAVNRVLADQGFDPYVERLCSKFYAKKMGRPGLAPGIYFRACWSATSRASTASAGSPGGRPTRWPARVSRRAGQQVTPDHSTISRTRRLIDLETHQAVFTWVLGVLDGAGLIKGKTIGVDATTLEANAAMRSIVRRDDGRKLPDVSEDLAKASGIETPTREDLARLDRKRKKKGSNDDWDNPHDPDAKITKMKDGRTHLAHKAEHAVDLDTGVRRGGDAACRRRRAIRRRSKARSTRQCRISTTHAKSPATSHSARRGQRKPSADKGYHSKMVLLSLQQEGLAHVHRRASTWSAEMAGAAGKAGRGVRESSTQERASRSRADASARRAHRAALRSRLRDRRHAAHSPSPPREHRQAAARAHRRAQPRPTHANALRCRQAKVPPGPRGRSCGRNHRVATLAADALEAAVAAPLRFRPPRPSRRSGLGLSAGVTSTTGC